MIKSNYQTTYHPYRIVNAPQFQRIPINNYVSPAKI